jgi:putative membrane protein
MKSVSNIFLFIAISAFMFGCETSRKDSSDIAEEKNKNNFSTRADENEAAFVADAIECSYAEIKLAELANTKSSNKKVQEVAQELVGDRTTSLKNLQSLAAAKGISIPVEEGEESKRKVNDLIKSDEPDFDKKWCDLLVDRHKKTIRDYESMQRKSDDTELNDIIVRALPKLRDQLNKLSNIEKEMM